MAKRPKDTREGDRHAGTAKTIRFTDAELALLDQVKEAAGGSYADAIAAAARAYLKRNDTRPDLALALRKLADEVERGRTIKSTRMDQVGGE